MTTQRHPHHAVSGPWRSALALCIVLLAFAHEADATYRVVELELPSDARGGIASDVNAAGDVVGHFFESSKGRHVATVWRAPAYLPGILPVDQVTYRDSEATRINDRGYILGEMHPRKAGVQAGRALWGLDGSVVTLKGWPGQQWNRVYDINANNVVVGSVMPHNGVAGAVAWPTPERLRWLAHTNAALRQGEAYAINDAGVIVGFGHASDTDPVSAFRWSAKGGLQILSGGQSIPYDVNEAGQAVGVSSDRAVIWEANGTMRDLGNLPRGGADDLQGDRINNLGIVIGRTQGSGEDTHFLWTTSSGMVRIADAIDPGDPWYARLHSGDAKLYVYGLNDAGTIVGAVFANEIPYGIPVMLESTDSPCQLLPVCGASG